MTYLFSVLGTLLVGGIIGYFLYRDAKKLRMESPGIWLLATMLFGVVSILVYVWARTRHKKQAALFEQLYRAT